jgi:hypothetical protein
VRKKSEKYGAKLLGQATRRFVHFISFCFVIAERYSPARSHLAITCSDSTKGRDIPRSSEKHQNTQGCSCRGAVAVARRGKKPQKEWQAKDAKVPLSGPILLKFSFVDFFVTYLVLLCAHKMVWPLADWRARSSLVHSLARARAMQWWQRVPGCIQASEFFSGGKLPA